MIDVVRTDLGGSSPGSEGEVLFSLVHLTDLHVLDASSPARAEWVELEAADPLYAPLLHMHRPYDTLTAFGVHAHVAAINDKPIGPSTGRPYDLAISTGDNFDNAQRNELEAYLALIAGGVAQLDAHGSAQDPSGAAFNGMDAVDPGDAAWPYWSPESSVADTWRGRGYPVVEDFVARASAPISSPGLGMPWTSVPGNHDLMIQGTALPNPSIEKVAIGGAKSLRRPEGFAPADPAMLYLDEPEAFSMGPSYAVAANPDRRPIDRTEWLQRHIDRGALGYSERNLRQASVDTVVDTEHIRFVMFDTNHPYGDFEGSIGVEQLAWLDDQLDEAERQRRLAVLVSHHGADTLINERGHHDDRRLADGIAAVLARHSSVIAWLVGHRHINRIEPRPNAAGGYWEITTASIIDWPSQARAVEVVRHPDGTIELVCTLLDHHDDPEGLATLHRDLARRFAGRRIGEFLAGRDVDGDVRLVLPAR